MINDYIVSVYLPELMIVESNQLILLSFISSITFNAGLAILKIPPISPSIWNSPVAKWHGSVGAEGIYWLDSVCPVTRRSTINRTFVTSITLPRQFARICPLFRKSLMTHRCIASTSRLFTPSSRPNCLCHYIFRQSAEARIIGLAGT